MEPLKLVEEILAVFQTSWNWTEVAETVLRRLGEGLGADRTYFYQVFDLPGVGLVQRCLFEWSAPDFPLQIREVYAAHQLVARGDATLDDWVDRRRRGLAVGGLTRDIDGYPRHGYERLAIRSFHSVPIHINRRWWGHVGICDCRRERVWSEAERTVLAIVGRLFADAVEMSSSSIAMSEETRRAITEALPDGLVLVDELGVIADSNPAADRLLAGEGGRAVNERFDARVTLLAPPEGADASLPAVIEAGSALAGRRLEARLDRADGSRVPVELTITEVRAGGRRLTAAMMRDLTQIKAAEAEIAQQRERLHRAERDAALGSLLAGVAHELNNPLAVVVAQSTLLEAKTAGTPFAERVGKIRAAADRCGRIVKGFLAMARRAAPVRQAVDLDEVAAGAVAMTAYGARSNGIDLVLERAGDLPAVEGDPDQLMQIVANLVINAQQALVAAPGTRRVRVATARAADGWLRLTVEDNGPGVPAALKPRIFEPYFTTKPAGAGTGIGLSVSHGMAEAHGGTLEHEDVSPHGARFVLSLPAMTGAAAAMSAPAPSQPSVLIVDDEPDVGASLGDILEALGAVPTVVTTAAEGLAALDRSPDVICTDLRMPGGGGLQFYRDAVARRPDLARRFVLVTGDTVTAGSELEAAGLAGLVRLLEKPFTIADVKRVWAEALAGR